MRFHAATGSTDDPRVQRVRDAYLEPFTRIAPRRALVECVELARRVGWLTRALAWHAGLDASLESHAEYQFPVRRWLLRILET